VMRQRNSLLVALGAFLVGANASVAVHDDIPDPPPLSVSQQLPTDLWLDPASVTVSGLSSGGFFAHQFHIAYSGTVTGGAILAGGPYGCVDIIDNPLWPSRKLDRTAAAVVACTNTLGDRFWGRRPEPPAAEDARQLIDAAHSAGEIDDPVHLAGDRVWLFRGELDTVIPEAVADSLATLYRLMGVDGEALQIEPGDPARPANHGMPVDRFFGESRFGLRDCDEYAPPFLIECGYDAAELLLRHLYPEGFLEVPVDPHDAGMLHAFNQAGFFRRSRTSGLSEVGYIYVPDACLSEECRLHVAFHGCRQNADAQGDGRIHDDFIRDAGYNRWAAVNRIVVLYPQATEAESNPRACWDFWGYSGDGWRSREGVQMRAVAAVIQRLLED
jgi:poly(3-hydroxybutyrate) depolymerase